MHLRKPNYFQTTVDVPATTRPVSAYGNSIQANAAANTLGAWTDMGIPSTVSDTYAIEMWFSSVAVAASGRAMMVDIGIAYDGIHNNYTPVIENLPIGAPGSYNDGGGGRATAHWFPFLVPAGARVGVRARCSDASSGIFRVAARYNCEPSEPETTYVAQLCQTLGADPANSRGTVIVPGTASEPSWVSLGTVDHDVYWIDFGYTLDADVIAGQGIHVDVGFGDPTTPVEIIRNALIDTNGSEMVYHKFDGKPCFIPAGSTIYVRSQLGLGTVEATQTIAVICFS